MLFKKSSTQFECNSAIKNDMKLPIALSVIKVTSNKEEDCPVKLLQPDEIYIIKSEFLIYDKWKVRLPLIDKGTASFKDGYDFNFIIEDNAKSVCTDTRKAWNQKKLSYEGSNDKYVTYYHYKLKYPHAGAGKRVQF